MKGFVDRWRLDPLLLLVAVASAACESANRVIEMGVEGAPEVPPVRGFGAGEETLFLHTEASDSGIAETLTERREAVSPMGNRNRFRAVREAASGPGPVEFASGDPVSPG